MVRPHEIGLWRKIGMDTQTFQECMKWKLGMGKNILLWVDEWIGRGSLKNQFPRIYAIAQSKKGRI